MPWIDCDTFFGGSSFQHPITVDNRSSIVLSESQFKPNPFLDLRYNVIFTSPSGTEYTVPGYFAGNGQGSVVVGLSVLSGVFGVSVLSGVVGLSVLSGVSAVSGVSGVCISS